MEVFADPLVLVCIIAMPLVIIGLAKAWKKLKERKIDPGAAEGGGASAAPSAPSASSSSSTTPDQ